MKIVVLIGFSFFLFGCSMAELNEFDRTYFKQPGQNGSYSGQQNYFDSLPATNNDWDNSRKTPMFYDDQCVGSIINGKCNGTLMPSGGRPQLYCYGTYTAYGKCIGTINY
jgi:hypothetical protein